MSISIKIILAGAIFQFCFVFNPLMPGNKKKVTHEGHT